MCDALFFPHFFLAHSASIAFACPLCIVIVDVHFSFLYSLPKVRVRECLCISANFKFHCFKKNIVRKENTYAWVLFFKSFCGWMCLRAYAYVCAYVCVCVCVSLSPPLSCWCAWRDLPIGRLHTFVKDSRGSFPSTFRLYSVSFIHILCSYVFVWCVFCDCWKLMCRHRLASVTILTLWLAVWNNVCVHILIRNFSNSVIIYAPHFPFA